MTSNADAEPLEPLEREQEADPEQSGSDDDRVDEVNPQPHDESFQEGSPDMPPPPVPGP